jgi:cytochrome b
MEIRLEKTKMKNLRNLLAKIVLMAILMVMASTVKAGILMTDDLTNGDSTSQPCQETKEDTKVDSGIIVHLTGIIVHFTGIIVHVSGTESTTDCGIIVH